jgi:lipid-A-disaccharide synthase
MAKPCLLMVAGERSGDVYGAELASGLRAQLRTVEIFGCGGEAMRRAGVETLVDAHQVSLMGITETLTGLPRAYGAFRRLVQAVDRRQPRLAVLIDFPSFNLRLAKRLKRRKIPVLYFVSPQIWAWKGWRIKEIKANVDKMLCIFDFEEEIYRKAGVPVEYVGHPLVDLLPPQISRQDFFGQAGLDPETTTVALLPGSREKEVFYNLPPMLDAASRLALTRKIQFVVAVAPTLNPDWMESMIARCYVGRATVRTVTHGALQHSAVAVVASGTATVEAALRERPMVVVYRVSPLSWFLGKFMIRVPFYSMVNLLAGRRVVPELIQSDFTGQNLANRVEYLLDHPEARQEMASEFRSLRPRLGPGGAIQRAVRAVLDVLERSRTSVLVS